MLFRSENEMIVYQTVFRRFVSVFCEEECLAQKTEIVIDVGGYEQFTLKGVIIPSAEEIRFGYAPPIGNRSKPSRSRSRMVKR